MLELQVVVSVIAGGVVLALPYGPGADWVRNVRAAGAAVLEHQGMTIALEQPQLLSSSEANPYFSVREQRTHNRFGVTDFLLLWRAGCVPQPGHGRGASTR